MKKIAWKGTAVFLVIILLSSITGTALAWQTFVTYTHSARYGGEAESGYHRGNVALAGGRRDITAGDDYVYWTSSQISWITAHMSSTQRPAMVYHAFAPNSNSCGGIRIVSLSWSYSNLPGVYYWSKRAGCWTGNNNEWRAIVYAAPTAGTNYWFQHVFGDTNYPSSNSTGEITVDSYWDQDCGPDCHTSPYNDYHGKFCINTTNMAYSPSGGLC